MFQRFVTLLVVLTALHARNHRGSTSDTDMGSSVIVLRGASGIDHPLPAAPIDLFEPTDEWKEIGLNQQLPGGLWIRINLSTGKKEARNLPK
ncbi:hypothetical protein H310_12674 [Aphanomyces invadans]|uniref:Secreted protein n=1 Tax=Aphanomyces invadans TaxID=157072 RepID=A0A024THI5_9STRA|nr:hypothetical protein H310_12674 [Aphanomyces invadans]ETV93429.1 hypothetical protein H310_12674 [Aphanomyces invadans]|eukprot:XP_008878065.1 hypothetical protein H310_12674 [Aphanomyces invadans]